MLLNSTIEFERLVKREKKKGGFGGAKGNEITWDNPVEIEQYINEIQSAANDLMRENRKLWRVHMNIVDKCIDLMNTDLIKDREVWKNWTNEIKLMIDQLGYAE